MSFKIYNIKVKISFWFLLFITLASVLSLDFYIVLLSVLLHEASHALVLYFNKGRITEIKFKLCEINIKSNVSSLPSLKALGVLLAGPLSNLTAGILLKGINEKAAVTNYVLGFFQLLPIFSSDLDNILKVILKGKFSNVLKILYFIFAVITFFIGVKLFIVSRYNYTLLCLGIFLIIKTLL